MNLFKMMDTVIVTVCVTFVVGVVSKDINLAQCQKDPTELSPSQTETMDFWTVPSSLMSDFSDTTLRVVPSSIPLNCGNFHEFEIQIPQIPSNDGHEQDHSNVDATPKLVSTEATSSIEIEFQTDKDMSQPLDNLTYFLTNAGDIDQDQAEGQETSHPKHKPVAIFTPTGYLVVNNGYFRPTEYCLKRISNETIGAQLCLPNCSEESPCIPICCSLDKVIYHNGSMEKCLKIEPGQDKDHPLLSEYRPTLYRDVHHKLTAEEGGKTLPHFYKHLPQCQQDQILLSYPFRRIHNVSGSIVRPLTNEKVMIFFPLARIWMEYTDFCLAGLVTPKTGSSGEAIGSEILRFSGNEEDQILYVCGDYSVNEVVAPHIYIPVYFINSFFLFITVIVYISLWDKQHCPGRTVLSFALAMFFMYIFLAWSHLLSVFLKLEAGVSVHPSLICPIVGILAHFFFLATFCWLSVINFDLWWTFKSMAPVSGRSKGMKRFTCYMIFAWGSPAIIIGVGLILSHLYSDPLSQVKVPGYGSVNCFLEPSAKGWYLYYDIGVLMGINSIFMILTLYTIYTFKKETRALDAARSNNSQSLSAKLFFKLFVVMGATWVIEVISWAQSVEDTITYWIVLDFFNILQSSGVFFIFVCKRKILSQLEQKYPSLKVITGPLMRVVVSRGATRNIAMTTSGRDRTQTTGFSIRNLSSKIKGTGVIDPQPQMGKI